MQVFPTQNLRLRALNHLHDDNVSHEFIPYLHRDFQPGAVLNSELHLLRATAAASAPSARPRSFIASHLSERPRAERALQRIRPDSRDFFRFARHEKFSRARWTGSARESARLWRS